MRKTFALLLTLALAASCTQQEQLLPVAPVKPDSDVLIVPGLSMGASGSGEATPGYTPAPRTTGTRGMTRATTYPYVIADALGKKTIVVTKDNNGAMAGATFHPRWQQTPYNNPKTVIDGLNISGSVSPLIEVAQTTSGEVPWETTNANCTAPWRRPTIAELQTIYDVHTQLELQEPFNTTGFIWYATATETDNGRDGYHVYFSNRSLGNTIKSNVVLVRCVRDAYPYVTTNADGKASVIVSQDEYGNSGAAMHTPWTQTPGHYENAVTNSISYRFEIDQSDKGNAAWGGTNGTCAAPWRRPTLNELRVIYSLKNQLTGLDPFAENYYWSASQSGIYICVFRLSDGVSSVDRDFITSWNTRCVRDLFDNFPDAPGSSVATLWGYTQTTGGLLADNLVPHTVIKSTPTGFVLETPRYYPADGTKKLYFYAHAPTAGATITEGNNPAVAYTLDGQKDVMWAKDDRGIAKSSIPTLQEQPFFRFQHKLMQLKFQLKADASFAAGTEKVTKITVKRVSTQASLTVVTGEVLFSGQGDISIAPTAGNTVTTAGITLAEMMLTEPKSSVILVVEVGGVTYPEITVNLAGTGAGAAGMSHLITLTLKRNSIVPTASTTDWTTGAGSDVGVI